MKKMKFIIVLTLIMLSLTACYEIDPQAEEKMDNLVNQESKAFISQAKLQYGNDVEVINIRAERRVSYDPVWIGATIYAGDNLFGTIKSKTLGEFNATYLPSKKIIMSHRNEERIIKSAYDDLASPKLNILDIQLRNSAREKHMLTDDIMSYEEIVDSGEYLAIRIITDSDISKLRLSDFEKQIEIMKRNKDEPYILSIEITEINNTGKTFELSKAWNHQGTDFNKKIKYAYEENREQDREIADYGVIASINIIYAYGHGYIEYINIQGEEVIYKMD